MISAVIITRNEKARIGRCLESLVWADEILVVDGLSDDGTADVCLDPSAPWASRVRVVGHEWKGFRDQRNYAIREARHDWILAVDADEVCSPPLAMRLKKILSLPGGPPCKYYKVRRQEFFLGKPIHYGVWNPSYQDRFFHREGIEYVNDIHEYPRYPSEPERIHEPLLHWPDFSPEVFLAKMNKYTTIEARDRVLAGQRTNWLRMVFAFPAMFWKNMFYYKAWRDGYHGMVISVLEGISRAVRHVKMWQFQRELDQKGGGGASGA